MQNSIFREYDIRGIVGSELVVDQVYALTQAILIFFKEQEPALSAIVIGMDGRTHSPLIKAEVCRAIQESGIDVIDIGVCPSPVLYYGLYALPVQAGLMITASHNPKEYNGIKLCLAKEAVWGPDIQTIKAYYQAGMQIAAQKAGSLNRCDLIPSYVDWLVTHFTHLVSIDFPIVFDCGNGASGPVMSLLIQQFGWKRAQLLYPEVDGEFPNHPADPVVEKNMRAVQHSLATTDALIGIGFDGDADRMGAMTKDGHLLTGDELLALFAQPILSKQGGGSVVCNVLASSGLLELIASWSGTVHMMPAGHSNIKDCMKKTGALVGGESSCHFFFADGRHFGYDDGIYSALRLIELVVMSGKTLASLIEVVPKKITSREYRIPCSADNAVRIVREITLIAQKDPAAHILAIDGVRVTLPYGWGIVRKSNTQDMISLRFESDAKAGFEQIKEFFVRVLARYVDTSAITETV